jgi:hypothetical protein
MCKTLLFACLVGIAAAKGGRYVKCTTSGDPHYQPFGTSGKAAKWTIMGEGEFTLAKSTKVDDDFHLSACSYDVSDGRTSSKKLTWNRDFAVKGDGVSVVVDGGDTQNYKMTVDGAEVADFGIHADTASWACDADAKGRICKKILNNAKVQIVLKRKNRKQGKGNQLMIKFKASKRVILANIYTKKDSGKFGKRTLFNIQVKVPKAEKEMFSGFCHESKKSIKGQDLVATFTASQIPGCTTSDVAADVKAEDTDTLVETLIAADDVPCTPDQTKDAIEQCSQVDAEDVLGCVLDSLNDCDTGAVAGLLEFEQETTDYSCPLNSYIDTTSWPITDFEDCKCYWGHVRDADAEACTPNPMVAATAPSPIFGACFCDGSAPHHCMQENDRSCGLPVLVSDNSVTCDNPLEALDSTKCMCSTGTQDCTGTSHSLQVTMQPAMAIPGTSFGQQPKVRLLDQNGKVVKDSQTKVRISIANAMEDSCKCPTNTPCQHDNVADNTCFSKHELFGEMKCPPGTTECLPTQTTTKLYQARRGEDPNDVDSLESKTTQCRTEVGTLSAAGNAFCSGMTPCKHQGDGHCMQKTAFYAQKVEEAPVDVETCKGTKDWRTATPSPVNGWYFSTDVSCSMDIAALGCTETGHSYAMDKWCDVNCHPKYPGQPAFCPASHCACTTETAPTITPDTPDWRCPADRYSDGTCRCTPGTEYCGAIETTLVNGIGHFQHLTIGNTGKYQLLVEVVMPDQNTGSNNVRVTTKTAPFEVQYPTTKGTECRAQAAWRKPAMYESEAHGEGKAWHYEDTKKCTSYAADGTCDAVEAEPEYAMDKWCKANKCLAHTLVSHCEFYTPAEDSAAAQCTSNTYDMFGECCESKTVDACGVCNGDGSTCKVTAYIAEPITITGQTAIIFNVSLADDSCDMKTPCMHLNDHTCGPKTVNSAELKGDEHHCYYDRRATADDQPNWKFGTWDIEGRLSKSIETQFEAGNGDCYCSAGTVDISKKIEIEDKAKEDFVSAIKDKIDEIVDTSTDGITIPEKVVFENSNAAYMYDAADCDSGARKNPLSSLYNNLLCGTHWDNADGTPSGTGNCANPATSPTCTNDRVRSIWLPAMTTAKLYKHCNNNLESSSRNKRYPTIENYGTTAKCFNLQMLDTSNIVIEGAVLKVTANIVGTGADCMESKCMTYVEKCRSDAECNEVLQAAESLVTEGEDFINALREYSDAPNAAFKTIFTCIGQASMECDVTMGTPVKPSPAGYSSINNAANLPIVIGSNATILPANFQIQPTTVLTSEAFSFGSSAFSRRLVAGATGTVVVQVTTGGNQGVAGTASSTSAATGQFATGASNSAASGVTSAGTGTAGAIGIAIGCTAIAALAVAFVVHQKNAGAAPVTNANAMTATKSAEDHTDVL